jgi:CRP/FNR family transcriptional regulator, dissimilatory nitrate respiration regulator
VSSATDMIQIIAAVPLFQGLQREHYEDLAMIVKEQSFNRGEVIFSEGDDATGFYVLISGRVKVFKLSSDGKEQILHLLRSGEPFGEVPVFVGARFPAHAEALEESRLLFFPRAAFVDLIKRNPSLAMNMLAVLSQRLRKFAGLVEDLSLREVPGRLAAYLLYLSKRKVGAEDLPLDVSKAQLASLLGTIPETLSRILTRMAKEGLIKSDGSRQIRLLDREGLEELACGARRLN